MSVLVDFADWSELVLLHALHVFGAANAPIDPALLSLNLSANMAELARRTNVNVHNPVSILLPATFNHLSPFTHDQTLIAPALARCDKRKNTRRW